MNSSQFSIRSSEVEPFTPKPRTVLLFSLSFETRGEKSESPEPITNVVMCSLFDARSIASTTIRMSAEFFPVILCWGMSISSKADSWKARLYSA